MRSSNNVPLKTGGTLECELQDNEGRDNEPSMGQSTSCFEAGRTSMVAETSKLGGLKPMEFWVLQLLNGSSMTRKVPARHKGLVVVRRDLLHAT